MGNIVLLDDLTINKIAAGEVIERPASVVKEMVENSIDAGAKNITIEIKNGGISLIKITDDGCGIAEDDMEIAFERHATSKIRKAEDLQFVTTMGFRGEALASIASIAKVEMISKKEGTDIAHKIVVEGGKTLEFTEAARSVGTTITVENLFYNTPVRYKFLKKDYTEAGYIEDAVTRIALVNRNVAIKLISNGKTIIQTNGNGDLKTVIYSIYGKDIASEIIEIDYQYEDMKVTGVIGKPVIARGNRANQLFFLNGRYIKDKNLTAAADQAYKGMIPVGRYGFIVLNLDINPKLVDVNVHPAKLEVRFEDESKVFKAIYHAIKSNLAKSELVENVEKENPVVDKIELSTKVNDILAKYKSKNQFANLNNINLNSEITTSNEGILENKDRTDEKESISAESTNNLEKDDSLENTKVFNEYKYEENSNEEKKGGITGLFKKIMKEPEETPEELNNNHLEEIFKYRQGLKNNSKNENYYEEDNETENTNISLSDNKETFPKTINGNEINKDVSFGNTVISSDTRELNLNIDLNMDKTQAVDLTSMKNVIQDTIVAPQASLSSLPQNTVVLENNSKTLEDDTNSNNENDSDEFAKIAEKLVTAKLDFDNTQTIDTNKVREALKETKFEENPEFDKMYKKTFGTDTFFVRKEKELEELEKQKMNAANDFSYATENMNVFEENEEVQAIPYKFLGIVFATYIIIEIKNEMYIIDQHAAHERIMYEKIKANYYSDEQKDEQFLLLPDVINLTHKEMIIARENADMFAKAGFSFEEFGDNTIKLNSVPSMCEELNTKQLFLDILDEIDTVAVTARQEKEDKFIATVACKSAVKAKMKLDEKEVKTLINKLLELPNPFTCPHGRPTAIKMTKYDLEKKFSRR